MRGCAVVDQTMSAHAAVIAVAGWEKSLVEAWPSDADDVDGAWVVGVIDEDGSKYPVITVEADQYDAPGDSEKIARALIVLWAQAFAARGGQTQQQPIGVTAVAVTRENEDGELCLDWLLEGGIAELEFAGQVLVMADKPITDDEGSGEVYAAPIAQTAPQHAQSGWISVDDRLPKRGQVIIVPRLNSTPFCGKYDPLGGQHRCLDRCLGKWWEFSRWMPMPNAGETRDV
jgi:hypothetical protein